LLIPRFILGAVLFFKIPRSPNGGGGFASWLCYPSSDTLLGLGDVCEGLPVVQHFYHRFQKYTIWKPFTGFLIHLAYSWTREGCHCSGERCLIEAL